MLSTGILSRMVLVRLSDQLWFLIMQTIGRQSVPQISMSGKAGVWKFGTGKYQSVVVCNYYKVVINQKNQIRKLRAGCEHVVTTK